MIINKCFYSIFNFLIPVKQFKLFVTFLLLPFFNHAAGIMGSDLGWMCVGKDSFVVKLTLYADCNQEPPVNQILFFYCKNGGALIKSISINNPSAVDISPTCRNRCTRCQDQKCSFPYGIHQYTYVKLVTLIEAAACCEIRIANTSCCWDTALSTIVNPANKNFYTEATLNRCISPCDNSPSFTNPPIIILCKGSKFGFGHGPIELDIDHSGGSLDSLVWELTPPLSSQDTSLEYKSPYSYIKPINFNGFPDLNGKFPLGFHLDYVTGNISFLPVSFQQTVMTVKISEYRNKVKIGEVRRNMYFIIIFCPENNSPKIGPSISYKEICAGEPVTFTINTNDIDPFDRLTLGWSHGIAGASWSDNNNKVKHPTGVFTWIPGENQASTIPYTFTATVRDDACPVSGHYTQSYQIYVKPIPHAEITVSHFGCGNFSFNVHPTQGKDPSFFWSGNSFNFTSPNDSQAFHRFLQKGRYPFTMAITEQNCERLYHDTVNVMKDYHQADLGKDTAINRNDVIQLDAGLGFISYLWNDGSDKQTCFFDAALHGTGENIIWVRTFDSNQCISFDTIIINVSNTTSIENDSLKKIFLFPNPTCGSLTIYYPGTGEYFYLSDLFGEKVQTGQLHHGKNELNMENNKGFFALHIGMQVFKIIKY